MIMDAANLNMINWAAALRGNRRKGAALLRAMLADPVHREAVCADPDALSLIFGYGIDDPLVKEAREIEASSVVRYANGVMGTSFADVEGMADGIYSIADGLEKRGTLWNMVLGVREVIEVFAENEKSSAWLTSALGSGDADAFYINRDIMAAGTAAGLALSSVVWENDPTASAFALRAMSECASNAYLLNGLAKSDAARTVWANNIKSVSMLYDTVKDTLDASPDSLFVKKDNHYETSKSLSSLSGDIVLTRASDGEFYGVSFTDRANWRSGLSGTPQITLIRNINTGSQSGWYRMCALVSPQKKDIVEKFSSTKGGSVNRDIKTVLSGGAGFFTDSSQSTNVIGDAPTGSSFLSVKYATYIAV